MLCAVLGCFLRGFRGRLRPRQFAAAFSATQLLCLVRIPAHGIGVEVLRPPLCATGIEGTEPGSGGTPANVSARLQTVNRLAPQATILFPRYSALARGVATELKMVRAFSPEECPDER